MSRLNVYAEKLMRAILIIILTVLACASCSGNSDNSHTTATTIVSPPARQQLRAESRPADQKPAEPDPARGNLDPSRPFLILNQPANKTIREGEEVVIDFSLANAKLRGDGGEYRVRYLVDDGDMQWLERHEQVALTGWLVGKHTIRVELVGPDGWPYRNGDYNVETREITVNP